jgi:hypothetical protein
MTGVPLMEMNILDCHKNLLVAVNEWKNYEKLGRHKAITRYQLQCE